jgi:hypothetical protein
MSRVTTAAVYEERRRTQGKTDPHVRCVAPGGTRRFRAPWGLLIYERPEARRVLALSGGGPRTRRVIYMYSAGPGERFSSVAICLPHADAGSPERTRDLWMDARIRPAASTRAI